MKLIRFLSLFLIGLFVYSFIGLFSPVQADSDFLTDYNITYNIDQTGLTHAVINGTLTNQTSRTYATSYKIDLGFDNITNATARDSSGSITPTISKTNNGYSVQLNFNAQVVGLHNKLHFTLTFDTTDIAHQAGQLWEVNIPGLANQIDFNNFQVAVIAPASFGPPSIIKPAQTDKSLIFTKEELGTSGISIAFGTQQVYDFSLQYHIANTNVFPIKTEIALPPTTNYQTIAISDIKPHPQNVVLDPDGNWLAQYYLLPGQKMTINTTGKAMLSISPAKQVLTDTDRNIYLQPQQYWQTTDKNILAKAQELKTPEAIYDFVVKTLTYDFNRVNKNEPRVGAAGVLKNPSSAVCLEFTDLFVALARAAGIPSREIDGFGYTQNTRERPISVGKDILHAWPEYYDDTQGTWIMVDPTWGNTTNGVDYFHVLDFDHLAFVVKGVEDDYPIPAGGYKTAATQNTKDVDVHFGKDTADKSEQLSFSPVIEQKYLSGFPMQGTVTVQNIGQVMTSEQSLSIFSSDLEPHAQSLVINAIPPYGFVDEKFSFDKVPFLTNESYPFTIQLADKTLTSSITVTPFLVTKATIIGGVILVLFTIIIFIIARKTRRLHLPR